VVTPDRTSPAASRAEAIATIEGLTIHYGKRIAVDGLSFELAAGEIVLMLGPNGAGKSTTLSAMAGALAPSAGRIRIGGEDLATAPRAARRKVGFADQPPALYEFFTVAEHVGFVAEARGATRADADAVLAELGLSKIAPRPCRELSFGMRQRVGLAAALVGPIELALLDETLNGLDPHASRSARAALRARAERGAAVLMSTHLLGVAEQMCDRILVMDKGKLIADQRGDELRALLARGPSAVEDLYVSLIADEGPT
jgi:ABC-2 type transport system ATP-binding protein